MSPVPAGEVAEGGDWDWMEEMAVGEETDDGQRNSESEDNDEDNLHSKLCTFTQTQKDFMNQHW